MRNVILVSILAVVLAVGAAAVNAGPPVNGTYKSTNGDFDEGREASSWPGGNTFLSVGNVLHAESWSGAALGGDWKILCPVVVDVTLLYSTVVAGTGQTAYLITYTGGYVELGGAGPWAGGDALYMGVIDTYYETRTLQFASGPMVGSVSDHAVSASIQGYTASCVAFGIGNGVWLGNSPGAKPANYPDYRDANCNAGPTDGHWGDIRDLTMTVQGCAVATKQATWGSVKSLYRD
jgi:hypothetical protein